jgi:acetyltransferase-like isoleucine patch superfamily enzyme
MDVRGFVWYYKFKYTVKVRRAFSTLAMRVICWLKNVQLGKNDVFTGIPRIHRFPNSTITIGDNCRFNSSKNSVKIGLYKPCAFVTMAKNAEIVIGKNVGGTSTTITAANKIIIGNNVLLGANTFIMDSDWHNVNPDEKTSSRLNAKPVVIEDGVFLGYNTVVLKGVTIGKNAVIDANSLVIQSIPANAIALGNPCKVIIKRKWGSA